MSNAQGQSPRPPYLLLSLLLLYLLPSPSLSLVAVPPPEIRIAKLPADLPAIQDCRRSAYAGKPVNLPAAKSFCNADQIQKEGYICIIARNKKDGSVLGTADLSTKSNVVNNVYVREEARKRGIARLMMEAVEDAMEKPSTLKLTVMSKNVPAVSLYKSMGFEAPGVYGGLDALSSVTPLNFLMEMEKKL
mmetsp:Transcript_33155/g.69642  ORF Transcript_33155/g.69642 Transcript_33155/m.69642 type:complete len:190 (-) Transcript_33155:2335-2904(-)